MTTKGRADVVFCLDASGSMTPCIDAVREHIAAFVSGLESSPNMKWDLRLDFVAHCCLESGRIQARSVRNESIFSRLYEEPVGGRMSVQASRNTAFFTGDIEEFRSGLSSVELDGDEAPLIALDCCLDFPWRDDTLCHRVVVLMTDEPFEGGADIELQETRLDDVVTKINDLGVMLFLVAPASDAFARLSAADRSEYEEIDISDDGLASVDFRQVLGYIGKSISVSAPRPQKSKSRGIQRALYGQDAW